MANKVKYGLSNAYYAVYDETAGTFGTPVALPGAVNPDSFRKDVMGELVDQTSGLQYEVANAIPKAFALLFQFEGDESATRHVLYYCKATRPTLASQTTEDTIEPVTETISVTATAINKTIGGNVVPLVKAKCGVNDSAYSTFFTAVQLPGA